MNAAGDVRVKLRALLAAGRPVPLTDQIRLDRRDALHLARQLPDASDLVRLLESAKRVPLTGQVRVDPAEVKALLDASLSNSENAGE